MSSMAQGAAGLVLVSALAFLAIRQVLAAAGLLSLQAAAAALTLLLLSQPTAAVLEFVLGAVAVPVLVRRLSQRADATPARTILAGTPKRTMLAGAALTVLALSFGQLGLPLAVVLLGLLVAATRREPIAQAVGLAVLQNGVALAAAPMPAEQAALAAVPVVPLLTIAALWRMLADRTRIAS